MRRYLQQTLRVRDFRVINAIAAQGSIVAASRALGVSQPAMSKALKSIELITGFSLFHRSATGVTPTAAGLVVLECAARVLHEVAALDRALADLDNSLMDRMPAHAARGSSGDFSGQGLSTAPRGL